MTLFKWMIIEKCNAIFFKGLLNDFLERNEKIAKDFAISRK